MRAFIIPNPLSDTSLTSTTPNPNGVHVLLHPSAIGSAPPMPRSKEAAEKADSLDVYVQDVLTVPASLAGLPAVSVPLKVGEADDGWPIGTSLVGQWGCESMVLRVAKAIEDIEG